MKLNRTFAIALVMFLAACSGKNIYIDKNQKAIISKNGAPLAKVVILGAGMEITLIASDNTKDNSVIYFNRRNPGFLTSDGFGLNKNFYLQLKPHTRYTVSCYKSADDKSPAMINFRTDYNSNLVMDDED